jgi:hypothetical protein
MENSSQSWSARAAAVKFQERADYQSKPHGILASAIAQRYGYSSASETKSASSTPSKTQVLAWNGTLSLPRADGWGI